MIPTIRSLTLMAAALVACTSTAVADVWSIDPVEGTEWKIGAPAKVKWQLKPPTAQTDVANIYLVGGDPSAYIRYATLGENIVLGDHDGIHSHNLQIPKVPEVKNNSTYAIEFEIVSMTASQIADKQRGDYYSHPFTISSTGDTVAKGKVAPAAADKSTPIFDGIPNTAATPNGPITHVQAVTNSTQGSSSTSAAAASTQQFAVATSMITMTVMITALALLL